MTTSRRRHFGNVRRLPSGRYQASYWHAGRRHTAEHTLKTKAEALAWLSETETAIRRGAWTNPTGGKVRFDEYATGWLATRLVKGRPLSPGTRQGYEGLLRRNLLPELGRVQLRDITPELVAAWHKRLIDHAGTDQAAKSYRLLRAILYSAVKAGRIARNPCQIDGAGIEHAAERPLVPTSLIFELAEAIAPRLRALAILAGFGGLRTGEMLALTRRDVDLVHGNMEVRAAVQEITGKGVVVGEPKSAAGRRRVSLPRVALEALEDHLAEFVAPDPGASLFAAPEGGPLYRSRLSRDWTAARRRVPEAPPGLRIHDLRHHAATLAARMPGITTRELMSRIGHSSQKAALLYQHAAEERDRAVAEHLDREAARARRARRSAASVVAISRNRSRT